MPKTLGRARLDSFSDGVIAVIITILVLELKVPSLRDADTVAALRNNAAMLSVYALSFVQVGIYWVNHHYLMDDLECVTHGVLWANLGLLFTLMLIPFGTEWIGVRGVQAGPVAVYAVCFLLPAATWTVLASTVCRLSGIQPAASFRKQALSILLNLSAIAAAFWHPWVGLALIACVAGMWLTAP